MTITANDIKLLASERMVDASDGGGRMTANEIPDNVPGNLFPKVSRVDAVYGRVNLRKVYVAVQTDTQDTYAGAHLILTQPPENERVHCCLFDTDSHFDLRSAAQSRVESYVVKGPRSQMHPIGTQLKGQKAVAVYQREEAPIPSIGDVYCLSVESGTYAGQTQYIRIMSVEHELRTFTYTAPNGAITEMRRRAVTLGISQALVADFPGSDPTPLLPGYTWVRETSVVDSAKYFGIRPLVGAVPASALSFAVDTIFTPLVPGVTSETPVVDVTALGASAPVACGSGTWYWKTWTYSNGPAGYNPYSTVLPEVVLPAYFYIHVQAGNTRRLTVNANGTVTVADLGGATGNFGVSGTASYNAETRVLSWSMQINSADTMTFYLAGTHFSASPAEKAHTLADEVTLGTRGTVYIHTLRPIPSPGTLKVDYRAQGKWYTLQDDGSGVLAGSASAVGVGSVNYATGAALVTLGALPDVGSYVIWTWGTRSHYHTLTSATLPKPSMQGALDEAARPGSVVFSWLQSGATKTATASAAGVVNANGCTGYLVHATGAFYLAWSTYPDAGSNVQVDYDRVDVVTEQRTGLSPSGGHVTFTLGTTPIRPGSVTFEWEVYSKSEYSRKSISAIWTYGEGIVGYRETQRETVSNTEYYLTAIDDGAGRLGQYGFIDYATGEVDLEVEPGVTANVWKDSYTGDVWTGWDQQSNSETRFTSGIVHVTYSQDTATPTASQKLFAVPSPVLKFGGNLINDAIVPGSLRFSWNSQYYLDRGDGSVYRNVDVFTDSGILAGRVDYQTREVILDDYVGGSGAVAVQSLLGRYGDWYTDAVVFRTPGSPLRPASLYLRATARDGTFVDATCDGAGDFSDEWVSGHVSQEFGIVWARFGRYVPESSLSDDERAEPWYDANDIQPNGTIWKPLFVMPDTLRHNTVVVKELPLDAELLGLDPVRLPVDGKVAVFRPGDVLVVHNTQAETLPNPVSPSALYSLPRGNLEDLWLEDQDHDRIPLDQYEVDLANGKVRMAASLNLADYTQPLVAYHRQEDMVVCTDAQIDGTLSVAAPLKHGYPVGSFCSSALIFGDLTARATNVFDQATWTSVWADTVSGSGANAQYDDLHYPIEVLNRNAIKERWRVNFTSATAFQLYGENVGLIATGTTSADLTPVNPVTGEPYFTLRAAGWGSGWAAGNQLRFNIEAGCAPVWVARTILSNADLTEDAIRLERRGDVD